MSSSNRLNLLENKVLNFTIETESIEHYLSNSSEFGLNIRYGFKTGKKAEDNRHVIRLDIELKLINVISDKDTAESNLQPFIEILHTTIFNKLEDDLDDEDFIQKFAPNMFSMSYPYIRAYISAVSALSGVVPTITLPAIDVYDVLEHAEYIEE